MAGLCVSPKLCGQRKDGEVHASYKMRSCLKNMKEQKKVGMEFVHISEDTYHVSGDLSMALWTSDLGAKGWLAWLPLPDKYRHLL